jgi:transposase
LPPGPSRQKLLSLRKTGTLNPKPDAVTSDLFRGSGEFFDPNDVLQVKYEMLREVEVNGASVSDAAPAFGFSRPSFYEAQTAFRQDGLFGLLPKKKGPQRAHKLDTKAVEFLKKLKAENPKLTSSQLADRLRAELHVKAHPRSIERALARDQKKRR